MSTVFIRFAARGPAEPRRAPLLERLLACGSPSVPAADWRDAAFRVLAPAGDLPRLAVGPAVLHAAVDEVAGKALSWACVATPVRLEAGMTSVAMPPNGILSLTPAAAWALRDDFNDVFSGSGTRLWATSSGVLLCSFERALHVELQAPEAVTGRDVFAHLPAGADSAKLRGLMSEVEMWLYQRATHGMHGVDGTHGVDCAQAMAGSPPITGLWFWGGGACDATVPVPPGWTAGDDPLFSAFGTRTDFPAGETLRHGGVIVADEQPGSDDWAQIEHRWLEPAAAALRAGDIDRLLLSAGARCVEVRGGLRLRLGRWWRAAVPWWERFDD